MEMKLVLDTSAYGDFRRYGVWKEDLSVAHDILVPTIVLGELRYGFARGNTEGVNLTRLRDFLRDPRVRTVTLSEETPSIYARFFLHLKNQGTPIPTNDVWIAAVAYEQEAVVCTRDRHFTNLPQVDVRIRDPF
jgi:tRNA(fMet)-specific endonuclease VapC